MDSARHKLEGNAGGGGSKPWPAGAGGRLCPSGGGGRPCPTGGGSRLCPQGGSGADGGDKTSARGGADSHGIVQTFIALGKHLSMLHF